MEIKKNAGVGVILYRENKILILKRKDGSWDIPGGKLEMLEPPKYGIIRESREETGISLKEEDLSLVDVISAKKLLEKHGVLLDTVYIVYKAKLPEGVDIILNPEHTEYLLLSKEDIGWDKISLDGEYQYIINDNSMNYIFLKAISLFCEGSDN